MNKKMMLSVGAVIVVVICIIVAIIMGISSDDNNAGQQVKESPPTESNVIVTPSIPTTPPVSAPAQGPDPVPPVTPAPVAPQTEDLSSQPVEEVIKEPTIQDQLRTLLDSQFKDMLSFPFNEGIMIHFIETAEGIKEINNRWDVQVASVESDSIAIEYSNMAVEEITLSFKQKYKLNLDQYNEMMMLTTSNPEFNQLYQAYRTLWEDGNLVMPDQMQKATSKRPAEVVVPQPVVTGAPATTSPQNTSNPAPARVDSGTVPATQDSSVPPYSPPVSR